MDGDLVASSSGWDSDCVGRWGLSLFVIVETFVSRKSSVAACAFRGRKEKINQVNPAKRDDEMKNKVVNKTNATMR